MKHSASKVARPLGIPAIGMPFRLSDIDDYLMDETPLEHLSGLTRFVVEFWFFGLKQARACLFAGLFFASVFLMPQAGIFGIPRYDALLVIALAIQAWMLWSKLESVDEVKAICIFHAIGFVLEAFKTSGNIQAWSYPDFAYTKVLNVPLFSGFMYAAVGSYIIQAWRLFNLRIHHYPPYWLATLAACGIYANFFTHHFIGGSKNAAADVVRTDRILHLDCGEHQHVLSHLGIPTPNGSLGESPSRHVGFVVTTGHHDDHDRRPA